MMTGAIIWSVRRDNLAEVPAGRVTMGDRMIDVPSSSLSRTSTADPATDSTLGRSLRDSREPMTGELCQRICQRHHAIQHPKGSRGHSRGSGKLRLKNWVRRACATTDRTRPLVASNPYHAGSNPAGGALWP